MPEENFKSIPTVDHKPHAAFFRQSGWLMMANIVAGVDNAKIVRRIAPFPKAPFSEVIDVAARMIGLR